MKLKHANAGGTAFFLVLSLFLSSIPASAELLVSMNGIYSNRIGYACAFEQNLFIQTDNPATYGKDQTELNDIIKTSIIKMQKKCINLKRVVINGALNGKWHYWGTASKSNNWVIKSEIVENSKGYLEPYMFPEETEEIYKRGLMFLKGGRLAREESEGYTDIARAARSGYPDAQYLLGRFHEEGFGVTKNKYNALALYNKAAAQGHQKAKERLDQLSSNNKQKELEKRKNLTTMEPKGNCL